MMARVCVLKFTHESSASKYSGLGIRPNGSEHPDVNGMNMSHSYEAGAPTNHPPPICKALLCEGVRYQPFSSSSSARVDPRRDRFHGDTIISDENVARYGDGKKGGDIMDMNA